MSQRTLAAISLLALSGLVACHPKPTPAPDGCGQLPDAGSDPLGGQDCDPLVPTQCGYPFPSSVYLVDDPSTVTGKHVQFRKATLPTLHDRNIDPTPWANSDGFSPGQVILTHLPGATVTGLATPDTIEASLAPSSPTVVLEVNADGTTRQVPHWAELDVSTNAAPVDQSFMIRTAERLKDQTRYIVAIRHVVDANGTPLAPTPVFQALRDCTPSTDSSVAPRRGLYADIFTKLKAAGIDSSDLQLAWDYTTASRDNNTRDMLSIRDQALAVVGTQGPEYTITSTTPTPNPYIALRIEGTMHVPLYLTSGVLGDVTARINRAVDGGPPTQNGWLDFAFLVQVPNAVTLPDAGPVGVVQQGHGLLGTRTEAEDGIFAKLAEEGPYITIAINLMGFATEDINTSIDSVTEDPSTFLAMVEPQHQGMVNQLLAMRMMIGRFVNEPLIQFNGHSAIDPTHCYYRGDSQGGIMGATYMAISTDVTRGYLGETGTPYNLLLNRSRDFSEFWGLATATYPGPRTPQIMLALMQMFWDRTEPDGYAPYITQNPLPGTPTHALLLNVAMGDFEVAPLGAHILARAVGAQNLEPVNRHLFGISEAAGPLPAGSSALTEFNFQLDQNPDVTLPITDSPPEVDAAGELEGPDGGISVDCNPHDKVRQETPVFMQQIQFFTTGQISNFCTGQALRPPGADKPGSCQFDASIPYTPVASPVACGPG